MDEKINKKQQILTVAEQLFNEFGYTAVGVDLIRDKAQVSKTSMYRHFGCKNNLIAQVLQNRHIRMQQQLMLALEAEQEAANRLDALIDWHFNWFEQVDFKGCMFMHALAEFKSQDVNLMQLAQQHKQWLKTFIQEMLLPDSENQAIKAEALLTLFEGLIVRAEFGGIECTSLKSHRDNFRLYAHILLENL